MDNLIVLMRALTPVMEKIMKMLLGLHPEALAEYILGLTKAAQEYEKTKDYSAFEREANRLFDEISKTRPIDCPENVPDDSKSEPAPCPAAARKHDPKRIVLTPNEWVSKYKYPNPGFAPSNQTDLDQEQDEINSTYSIKTLK